MADIKEQKLIYHITDFENLESIFEKGLLPRSALDTFSDVADPDILAKRKALKLEQKVPFHFFAKNPFDGAVVQKHPDKQFVLIGVSRATAQFHGWEIIPRHPLANQDIQLMNYQEGMAAIDWDTMNRRDYNCDDSKSVCMAECLAPSNVACTQFQSVFVQSEHCREAAQALAKKYSVSCYINLNPSMFPKIKEPSRVG